MEKLGDPLPVDIASLKNKKHAQMDIVQCLAPD